MRLKIKTNTWSLLTSSIITFACLIYILYQVNTNLVEAINIYHTPFQTRHFLIGFGHLFILLFHLYAIIYIFVHFRRFTALKRLKTVALILAVISLFAMGVEKVMIDEIAREYRYGLGISELYILNFAYIINLVFAVLIFFLLLRTFKLINDEDSKVVHVDETIFVIGQYLGILSGITGIWFTLHMIHFIRQDLLMDKFWVLIPFYILFLIPYSLAALYWLTLKRKQRIYDWYDEKQLQDMFKSSFTTLVLSVPGLAVLTLLQIPHPFFWLLYYIFLILLLFSGSTLYYFKIKDAD
jgi:hypothetical protein